MSTPRRRRSAVVALVAQAALLAGCGGGSDSADTTSTAEQQASGGELRLEKIGDFDQPVYVTQPPGSRDLYVVERQGIVRIVRDGETVSTPALDITGKVTSDGGEQGLLSVAFPPDFQGSRLAYAYYTGNDQDQHVVGFGVADDGSFDTGSEREILHMEDFASNHNGGLLLFGPDGRMYIGTGDGGIADDPERNGQDTDSLLGKILRIDPRPSGGRPYTVPAQGPLGSGARPEICNYGLRNPWRFSFDRATSALLIGDVGQNTQEEIDYVPAERACGNNFGWSAFEGTNRFNDDQTAPNALGPVLTYGRDEGCSVTGGYVVRDQTLPALAGRYVYGDFCAGELRSFGPATPRARDDGPLNLSVPSLSSFGQDNDGHVYAVSLDGPVYRLAQ
ncbi:MAG TPA: PQQ-dependent sugar dehydrogenase [Solirubrobacterales bacterium]|nr:PQQ-dependent sugar dehydrogenase [Solirubrobacterales bacterium]